MLVRLLREEAQSALEFILPAIVIVVATVGLYAARGVILYVTKGL